MSENQIESIIVRGAASGDHEAFQVVVDAYFARIAAAAEKRIAKTRQRASDGEDVAASVFESLWKKADAGLFAQSDIPDESAMWRYLQRVMHSKLIDHMRRETADKRGGGVTRGESVFVNASGEVVGELGEYLQQISPAELFELAESQKQLLDLLPDDALKEIAISRMEGYEVKEIAERLRISDRSVKRKLAIIRDLWNDCLA